MSSIKLLRALAFALAFVFANPYSFSKDVQLAWDASTTPDVTYNLYRAELEAGGEFVKVNASPILELTYTDQVLAFVRYAYVATAENENGESGYSNQVEYIYVCIGDVNMDGVVDIADAVYIARYTAGLNTLTPEQELAADVNGDSLVDIADAVYIARYTAGLNSLEPCQ